MNRFKKGIMKQERCGVLFPNQERYRVSFPILKAKVMIDSGSLPQYIIPANTAKYNYGLTEKKDIFLLSSPFFLFVGDFRCLAFQLGNLKVINLAGIESENSYFLFVLDTQTIFYSYLNFM